MSVKSYIQKGFSMVREDLSKKLEKRGRYSPSNLKGWLKVGDVGNTIVKVWAKWLKKAIKDLDEKLDKKFWKK